MLSSDSESDDGPIQRPIGRMAARLHAHNEPKDASTESAYEKVRAMLMGDKNSENQDNVANAANAQSSTQESLAQKSPSRPVMHSSPASRSTPPPRRASPGLFVSSAEPTPEKEKSPLRIDSGSESDLPERLYDNPRFRDLIARKRAEVKAQREAERKEREERLQRLAERRSTQLELGSAESDATDDENTKKLSQRRGAPRRAGKKAQEEMDRETQRITRNMQLAHQARTRKKYTTKDLFKTFGYRQDQTDVEQRSTTPDVAHAAARDHPVSSDVERADGKDTPPTSPPSHDEEYAKHRAAVEDAELPPLNQDIVSKDALHNNAPLTKNSAVDIRRVEVAQASNADSDSDDLEIIQKQSTRFAIFDRLPVKAKQAPQSLTRFRAFARPISPSKSKPGAKDRSTMTPGQLQALLQRRAREQAQLERQEKINELRAKGIYVQTEEERQKDQFELENMLEKARQADLELAKKEQATGKEGEVDADITILSSDDDESYRGDMSEAGNDDDEEEEAIEYSGSEDEDMNNDELEAEEHGEDGPLPTFVDGEANETDDESVDIQVDTKGNDSDEETNTYSRNRTVARRRHVVLDDDEEEDGDVSLPVTPSQVKGLPKSTLNADITTAFGFDKSSPQLGLTQMFAGTMAESEPESLIDLPSTLPDFDAPIADGSQDMVVHDSQSADTQDGGPSLMPADEQVNLGVSQFPSQAMNEPSQFSQFPDPTQDMGFQTSNSQVVLPLASESTVTTVRLVTESPIAPKKGRLRRKNQDETMAVPSDIDEEEAVPEVGSDSDGEQDLSANAFSIMRKARRQNAMDDFDKKKSDARKMVDEQADESEDEYAGLGGASDDESDEDGDAEMAEMIDESEIKVDERKMAALFAEKDRVDDEKRLDKLYKDITTGALRRKRNGDFDLSDSDDDAAERRRRKQREFAMMRKALLADENVGKIAENPKKSAFFRAIEDRDDDSEADFLGVDDETSDPIPDSQEPSDTTHSTISEFGPNANPLKGKAIAGNEENRPPTHHRRTAPTGNKPPSLRKPVTIAEIRESVSFLIEEPHMVPDSQLEMSDTEDEADTMLHSQGAVTTQSKSSRRTTSAVVNRLSLSRDASDASGISDSALAFVAPSRVSQGGFKVPALVRRATSRLSESSSTSASASGSAASSFTASESGKVRRGGSARSNIHYQAREAERKKLLDAVDEKRKEGLRKKVKAGGNEGLKRVLGGANAWDF